MHGPACKVERVPRQAGGGGQWAESGVARKRPRRATTRRGVGGEDGEEAEEAEEAEGDEDAGRG